MTGLALLLLSQFLPSSGDISSLGDGGIIGGCVMNSSSIACNRATLGVIDAGVARIGYLDAGLIQVTQPTGVECALAIESAGTEQQYLCFNRLTGNSASGTYIAFNPGSNATTFSTAAGLTVGGGDLSVSTGRLSSRNATGGITLGVAGTAYFNMAAGTNQLDTNAADFNLAGLSTLEVDGDDTAYTGTPTATTFCTSPSVVAHNGTFAFEIDVGTSCSTSTATITLGTTAATGWFCSCFNITTPASNVIGLTGGSTTTCTLTNYARTTGLAANWTDGDNIRCTAWGL